MKAKDTVMSDGEALEAIKEKLGLNRFNRPSEHRGVQAEISFKAGITEVVEWVHQYQCADEDCVKWQCFERDEWEAQLKEWGIK